LGTGNGSVTPFDAWQQHLADNNQRAMLMMASVALPDRLDILCDLLPKELIAGFRAMAADADRSTAVWHCPELNMGCWLARTSPRRIAVAIIRDVTAAQMVALGRALIAEAVPDDTSGAAQMLTQTFDRVLLAERAVGGHA
jgi:hypothetical protein